MHAAEQESNAWALALALPKVPIVLAPPGSGFGNILCCVTPFVFVHARRIIRYTCGVCPPMQVHLTSRETNSHLLAPDSDVGVVQRHVLGQDDLQQLRQVDAAAQDGYKRAGGAE